jgi:hypothetical protein
VADPAWVLNTLAGLAGQWESIDKEWRNKTENCGVPGWPDTQETGLDAVAAEGMKLPQHGHTSDCYSKEASRGPGRYLVCGHE